MYTDSFKKEIAEFIENKSKSDELLAKTFSKPNKNIDDCVIYILNYVKNNIAKDMAAVCTKKDIFSLVIHYYDEDNIDIGKPVHCNVISSTQYDLTEDDKKIAKQIAMRELIEKDKKELTKKPEIKKESINQESLF